MLDPVRANCLACLCHHLNGVSAAAAVNKMDSDNLGIVFGPTVFPDAAKSTMESLIGLLDLKAKLVVTLVRHASAIFSETLPIREWCVCVCGGVGANVFRIAELGRKGRLY